MLSKWLINLALFVMEKLQYKATLNNIEILIVKKSMESEGGHMTRIMENGDWLKLRNELNKRTYPL